MTAAGFCVAEGKWRGTSSVYDDAGVYVGDGTDQRHVRTELDDGRVRIDLSFSGPFELAGHYVIEDRGIHRLYAGPVNRGFAEALGDHAVQAEHYWPDLGMTQRFFLLVLPDDQRQLSLALMSRGEQLQRAVVGQNDRVGACAVTAEPDTADVHATGTWRGQLTALGADLGVRGQHPYEQTFTPTDGGVVMRTVGGGFAPEPAEVDIAIDGAHAWTRSGGMFGSYSLCGSRALSGDLHRDAEELRVWRREVVSRDGSMKAIVHNWYRGGERVGVEVGVLEHTAE